MILFSIIIPTFNRPQALSQCLQTIAKVDYLRERFEVIVVDDGSSMTLDSVIEPFKESLNIKWLKQKNAGPANARNSGVQQASGEYVIFIDDDCQVEKDWLKKLAARICLTPKDLIGGKTVNALVGNPYSVATQLMIDYLYYYYNNSEKSQSFFTSNNFTVSLEQYKKLSGFHPAFSRAAGEDREFCDRWLSNGYAMVYAPEIMIYHAHELTLIKFLSLHTNYGRGAYLFHSIRAKRKQANIKPQPLTFYIGLLYYPFSQQSLGQAVMTFGLLVLSQVANVAGFLKEFLRSSSRYE